MYESSEYRASKNWPYSISAGCVVYREQNKVLEVLLLVRDASKLSWGRSGNQKISYHLPKGHVGRNETLEQAAIRETKEEAAVMGDITVYLGARTDAFTHPNTNINTQKTVHYFAMTYSEDLPKMDNEHTDKSWVNIDDAVRLLGAPNPKGEDEIVLRLKKLMELANV